VTRPTTDLSEDIDDLDMRFWSWRAAQAPRTRDDLPRIDRPAGWRPAWSSEDVAAYRRQVEAFEAEHAEILARVAALRSGAGHADGEWAEEGADGEPADAERAREERADEVDVRLIGSAIAHTRFELDGLSSWRRDPWFYLDQTIGTVFDLLVRPAPIDEQRCRELLVRLESFGATLAGARENLAGHLALELAEVAHQVAPGAGADLLSSVAGLAPFVGPDWSGPIDRAARRAAAELESYAGWLAGVRTTARPLGGVGEDLFARYMYTVALLPFTPTELLAAGRQEWDRSVSFELLEQHRAPSARWPSLPASAAEQSSAEAEAEIEVRRFYEDHDLLTQPQDLRHYLNAPRPAYVEPLRWLGVTDDLTGPDRLDEDGVSYVPAPSPDLPYFYRANAADPRAGIVHEGAHYQQLALAWRHPRPSRRHFYDSCPNEGIAFYNEEMLMQAGLFDDAPVTRQIIYSFMRLRALRVEADVRLALGQMTVEEAGMFLERQVPMDRETAKWEAAFFAATPAQGLSYTVGKLQVMRLLADVRSAEASSFSLREFHDWLWRNGNVPLSLLRYERLGDRSELARVEALLAGSEVRARS
jgi:Bacterial protein of unknown function (DUF885)